METVEQQTLAEQESLLAECRLYKGEKEPNTKDDPKESEEADVVTGLPVGPATTVVGAPLPRTPGQLTFLLAWEMATSTSAVILKFVFLGPLHHVYYTVPTWSTSTQGERLQTSLFELQLPLLFGSFSFQFEQSGPCFSVGSRVTLRRKYNLEGNGACLASTVGRCSGSSEEDIRERCDSICDIFSHFLFHSCALCQEGRELRRRTIAPAYQPYMHMTPPMEQHMSPQMM